MFLCVFVFIVLRNETMNYFLGDMVYVLITLIILSSNISNGAKILSMSSIPYKSHFTCNNAIMRSLRDAGHEITIVTSFPQQAALENYGRVIDTTIDTSAYVGDISYDYFKNMKVSEILGKAAMLEEYFCNKIFKSEEYQDLLNSMETYDVVFMETHMFYECLLPVVQKLKVPVIAVITHRSWYLADRTSNNPNHPANIPFEFGTTWAFNNFYERLMNVWNYVIAEYVKYWYILPAMKKFSQDNEEILKPLGKFADIEPALIFYNTHHSILPRPMNPNAIEIGGLHVSPAKPLPENIFKFVEEAKNGVILFTLGSMLKTCSLPPDTVAIFMNVFAKIPQRVIWKYEEKVDNVPEYVMLMEWLPQRDILEHHNVKTFISHCGLGGMYEAIHTATPVIACPLGVDQPGNAAILEHLGVAVTLNMDSLSEESVLRAINKIVNDTKYFNNMQTLSKVFHDRPMTPQQTVVYWTEYVIRRKGASNLKPPSSRLNWFQYFLLDVICFAVILFICVVYFTYQCVKIMVTLCRTAITKNKLD